MPAKPRKLNNIKFYIILVLLFLIGSFLGFIITDKLKIQVLPPRGYPIPKDANLPIPLELLQNPNLSGWSANVLGKVVDKKDDTFTLSYIILDYSAGEKDQKKAITVVKEPEQKHLLTIKYIPNRTSLVTRVGEPRSITNVPFEDLPIGTIITGNIEISLEKGKTQLTGGGFNILQI